MGSINTATIFQEKTTVAIVDQEATMMKEGPQMQGPNHLITTAKKDKRVGAIRIEHMQTV